jgi:hypothetical protein
MPTGLSECHAIATGAWPHPRQNTCEKMEFFFQKMEYFFKK